MKVKVAQISGAAYIFWWGTDICYPDGVISSDF